MDALQESDRLVRKWSAELGYVRGVSLAARLASASGNHDLASRLYLLAFETENAHTAGNCPGHVASEHDAKICGHCGTHVEAA